MSKHALGLASIKLSAIAGDGGMGTSLTAVGDTVLGTAVFGSENGTTTDIFTEESDTAIESILSQAGTTTLTWSTNNIEADNMVKFFGGTKTTGPPVTYEPPNTFAAVELSIEVIDKKGNKLEIVRASVKPQLAINFNKTTLGAISIVATVLLPTKAATQPWKFTYA
jgi:hypothetical protein